MPKTNNLPLLRENIEIRLRKLISQTIGAFGLCVIDLADGWRVSINGRHYFPQASAIKIPILMEVFKQAQGGKLNLSETRRIQNSDKIGGSGVLTELGNGTVELTLRDLAILMITVSDNTATNLLIDLVGMANVNKTLKSLGLKDTTLSRRMMDMSAVKRGDENVSTPEDAARIMEILFRGTFVSRAICDDVLDILKKPKTSSIATALPSGTAIASKPGSIPGVVTEWAVVYLKNNPYILTVMGNYGPGQESSAVIKEISKVLYEHFSRVSQSSTYGVLLSENLH